MSENEVKSGTESCQRVGTCVAHVGVVAVVVLLVVIAVLLLPISRDASRKVDLLNAQTAAAAVYIASGDTAFVEKRFDDAAMDYMLAASLQPSDPVVAGLISRARIAGIASNPSVIDSANALEVRNDTRIVLQQFPSDATSVKIVQAMLKVREAMVPEAIAILEEAGRTDSQNPNVRLAQAVVWQFDPKKSAGVPGEFDAVVAMRPDDINVLGAAGQYFLSTATPEKGLAMLKTASAKKYNLNWLKVLGQAALQSGDKEAALLAFQTAYGLAPRDPDVLAMLGQSFVNAGEYEKAVQILSQAVSIRESRQALFGLAFAYNALSKFDMALPILSKMASTGSDIMTMFELANSLAGVGRKDEALKIYNSILASGKAPDGMPPQLVQTIKEKVGDAIAALGSPAPMK